jgi:hypothetical protein
VIGDLWSRGAAVSPRCSTRESFEAARAESCLRPAGYYCQWIPMHQNLGSRVRQHRGVVPRRLPEHDVWKGDSRPARQSPGARRPHTAARLDVAGRRRPRPRARGNPDPSNPYLSHPAGLWLYFAGVLRPGEPRFQSAPSQHRRAALVELASSRLHVVSHGGEAPLIHRPCAQGPPRRDARRSSGRHRRRLARQPAPGVARLSARISGRQSLLSFEGNNEAADRLGMASSLTRSRRDPDRGLRGRRSIDRSRGNRHRLVSVQAVMTELFTICATAGAGFAATASMPPLRRHPQRSRSVPRPQSLDRQRRAASSPLVSRSAGSRLDSRSDSPARAAITPRCR